MLRKWIHVIYCGHRKEFISPPAVPLSTIKAFFVWSTWGWETTQRSLFCQPKKKQNTKAKCYILSSPLTLQNAGLALSSMSKDWPNSRTSRIPIFSEMLYQQAEIHFLSSKHHQPSLFTQSNRGLGRAKNYNEQEVAETVWLNLVKDPEQGMGSLLPAEVKQHVFIGHSLWWVIMEA